MLRAVSCPLLGIRPCTVVSSAVGDNAAGSAPPPHPLPLACVGELLAMALLQGERGFGYPHTARQRAMPLGARTVPSSFDNLLVKKTKRPPIPK